MPRIPMNPVSPKRIIHQIPDQLAVSLRMPQTRGFQPIHEGLPPARATEVTQLYRRDLQRAGVAPTRGAFDGILRGGREAIAGGIRT